MDLEKGSDMKGKVLARQVATWITMGLFIVNPMAGLAMDTVAVPDGNHGRAPMVRETANGTTLVDIRRPNGHGLSHNEYTNLQVGEKGLILNNSGKMSKTQLAGYVDGNFQMVGTKADVILNEVTGSNRTAMQGYVEVAGNKADVIIANPNGISVNGGGFINAGRATLTTGRPNIEDGALKGYRVDGGQILVTGQGLNAKGADALEIYTKAAKVNAGIWANKIKGAVGSNDIDVRTGQVKAVDEDKGNAHLNKDFRSAANLSTSDDGSYREDNSSKESHNEGVSETAKTDSPSRSKDESSNSVTEGLMLDVSSLGAMYADSIYLVGTDKGLGVNVDGKLAASKGDLELLADGTLQVKGTMYAGDKAHIEAQDIKLTDTALAQGKGMKVQVNNSLINEGSISADATSVKARKLDNATSGTIEGLETKIEAENLHNEGLINGNKTSVQVKNKLDNTTGGRIYGDQVNVSARELNNTGKYQEPGAPVIKARDNLTIEAERVTNTEHAVLSSDGDLFISGRSKDSAVENTKSEEPNKNINTDNKTKKNRDKGNSLGTNNNKEGVVPNTTGVEQEQVEMVQPKAKSLVNSSATIEAKDNMTLDVEQIKNENLHFSTQPVEVAREWHDEVTNAGNPNRYVLNTPDHIYGNGGAIPSDHVDRFYAENVHLKIYGASYEDWSRFLYTRIITDDQVKETDPGKILAGKNMRIFGNQLINDKSQILAGGTLKTEVADLQNIEAKGIRTIEDVGDAHNYSRHKRRGHDSTNDDRWKYHVIQTKEIIVPATKLAEGQDVPQSETAFQPIQQTVTENGTVQTTSIASRLSLSALYQEANSPDSQYFIETDPAYANKKKFLSSDYYLDRIATDPKHTMKRLGDGYYELGIVMEQITKLIGKRKLSGYTSDEEEYKDLMEEGVRFANEHNVVLGDALTADQQKGITKDMVILTKVSVLLPSGQIVEALVPQVYLVSKTGTNAVDETEPRVALISANDLQIMNANTVTNKGTMLGQNEVVIAANNVANEGTLAGDKVAIDAKEDIRNIGGTIAGTDSVTLQARRDIIIASKTLSDSNEMSTVTSLAKVGQVKVTGRGEKGKGYTGNEGVSNSANVEGNADKSNQSEAYTSTSVEVNKKANVGNAGTNGANLVLQAGRNITIAGSAISNQSEGDTALAANQDIKLDSIKTSSSEVLGRGANKRSEWRTNEEGSYLTSNGNLILTAGNNIEGKAVTIGSNKDLTLSAGNGIKLTTGHNTVDLVEDHKHTGKSGGGHSQTTQTHDEWHESDVVGNTIVGKNVSLISGQDTSLQATDITSAGQTRIQADGNTSITGDTNHLEQSGWSQTKKKSLVTRTQTDKAYLTTSDTVTSSNVSGESVSIATNKDLQVDASNIAAEKNVSVTASGKMDLGTMTESGSSYAMEETKKSGLFASGMGITIGKMKEKSTNTQSYTKPIGINVTAIYGKIDLTAGDDIKATSANLEAQQDITLNGKNVTLDAVMAQKHYGQTYERSTKGLTASLGGSVVSAITSARQYARSANDRNNKTLAGYEYYQGVKTLRDGYNSIQQYGQYSVGALQKKLQTSTQNLIGQNVRTQPLLPTSATAAKSGAFIEGNRAAAVNEVNSDNLNQYDSKKKEAQRDQMININLSLGSSDVKQSMEEDIAQAVAGRIESTEGTVHIIARGEDSKFGLNGNKDTEAFNSKVKLAGEEESVNKYSNDSSHALSDGNIDLVAQTIKGQNVVLQAANDITIKAAHNTDTIQTEAESHGSSLGLSVGFSGHLAGLNASAYKSQEEGTDKRTSYTGTILTGDKSVILTSGQDTTITGSKVEGKKVTVTSGRNLTIETLQDSHDYTNHSSSKGLSISVSPIGIPTIGGNYSRGRMNSQYASASEQAGIYAGTDGYHITTGDTTKLTGALIASQAGKETNDLTTKSLVMEDLENKADYTATRKGVNYNYYGDYGTMSPSQKDAVYNQMGLTPDIAPEVKGNADSTTYSAISDGDIHVADGQTDLAKIRKDTQNTLNKLAEIFNKKKVEEKQELAMIFSQYANEAIHKLSEQKGWKEGSPEKIAMHSLVGGITSSLVGGKVAEGALPAGMDEAALPGLLDALRKAEPGKKEISSDKLQWASAVLGYAVNKMTGASALTGAATAQLGTKYNSEASVLPGLGTGLSGLGLAISAPALAAAAIIGRGIAGSTLGAGEPQTLSGEGFFPYPIALGSSSVPGNSSYGVSSEAVVSDDLPASPPPKIWKESYFGENGRQYDWDYENQTYVATNIIYKNGWVYLDNGGYDILSRVYLSGYKGSRNILTGDVVGPDGQRNWRIIPAQKGDSYVRVKSSSTGQIGAMTYTYGDMALLDNPNETIVYNSNMHQYQTTHTGQVVSKAFVEANRNRITDSTVLPQDVSWAANNITTTEKPGVIILKTPLGESWINHLRIPGFSLQYNDSKPYVDLPIDDGRLATMGKLGGISIVADRGQLILDISFENIVKDAIKIGKNKSGTRIWSKDGGVKQMWKDFDSLGISKDKIFESIGSKGPVTIGIDEEGNKYVVREFSSDTRVTLEKQNQNGKPKDKVRYNNGK